MIIFYVAGGSYNSFYLNYFLHLTKCNLLIFNFGVFKNISKQEITKELIFIANKLKCKVLAGVEEDFNKKIVICDKLNSSINKINENIKFTVCNREFNVTSDYSIQKSKNKIVFSDKQIIPNIKACSNKKVYLFCDKNGVNFVINKKLRNGTAN